ncbi:MAG: hypothetical protein JWM95_5529 [Gemmatimonadetes bacterium]|nr:hypothetical protein [Gemmatimonadota bacterium]
MLHGRHDGWNGKGVRYGRWKYEPCDGHISQGQVARDRGVTTDPCEKGRDGRYD